MYVHASVGLLVVRMSLSPFWRGSGTIASDACDVCGSHVVCMLRLLAGGVSINSAPYKVALACYALILTCPFMDRSEQHFIAADQTMLCMHDM